MVSLTKAVATVKQHARFDLPNDIDWLDTIGPVLSIDNLPPPETKRWVIRRKAEVVAAVRAGVISLEDACRRYTLSIEEFLSWQRLVDSHGLPGLRVTRLQDYRGAR
jgi:hypothetical protein